MVTEFRGMAHYMAYFVPMCYGHSISSPSLTLSTNTTRIILENGLTVNSKICSGIPNGDYIFALRPIHSSHVVRSDPLDLRTTARFGAYSKSRP